MGAHQGREAPDLGWSLRTSRIRQGKTLSDLSRELGGTPSESYLWRVEKGRLPSPTLSAQLARALRLPEEVVLNAAGYATRAQQEAASSALTEIIGAPEPVLMKLPVVDADAPDRQSTETSPQVLRENERGFVVRLHDEGDAPFVGEVVAVFRPPRDEQGVIVKRDGRLSAWRYHAEGRDAWLENAAHERLSASDVEFMGSIIRVVQNLEA